MNSAQFEINSIFMAKEEALKTIEEETYKNLLKNDF